MERLTMRAEAGRKVFFSEDACFLCGYNKKYSSTFCENTLCESTFDRSCPYLAVIDRLADYEDTGLTPEEVKDMAENAETRLLTWFEAKYGFPVGKLMDLCEAEQQGRLVVLPCKVGETVYRIVDRGYLKDTCETDCYSCNILCPYEGREYERVIEIVPWEMVSIGAIVNAMEQLGKTVFLTREQAEQALQAAVQTFNEAPSGDCE